ncbi:MAG: carboxymuconolactone decarboxylase family protein [Thermoleophilia bacterium]|nr:carboxymuconolactone decarboxylase family protein [Thermoleophilia bacterium]
MRVIWRERRGARALMRDEVIDAQFRERLMLAVTEVNGCRYCSYAHARAALKAGLTEEDIAAVARGEAAGSPPDQAVALVYARHWAEADAKPDPEARQRVLETYGETKTGAIELTLRMIRIGNLMGNTSDYLLYRVSAGRWGGARPADRPSRLGGADATDAAEYVDSR